ncbi:MAG TPA: fibronectin type III domain-containing protein, partial [Ignavibacteria bacterium]|nr:fibronectin type III domain-containing protein [Ignavibacteria bacterium]
MNDSTVTDTLKAVTGLNPLTTYYWKVRGKGASDIWTMYSGIYNFKTAGSASQVALSSPANGSLNMPVNITFNWYKAVDQTLMSKNSSGKKINTGDQPLAVTNYWFEYGTDSTFAIVTGRDSTISDTTYTVSGLSNNTKYYWRVKAKNQIGWNSFSEVWNFTTIVPVPASPALINPVNNSTGNPLNLNLIWSKPQFAAGYNVILASDPGFTNIVINDSTITDTLKAITNLNPLTTYYWKVRAKDAAGWSAFSIVSAFKTVGTAAQVFLASPSNGVTSQPVTISFKWYKTFDQTEMVKSNNGKDKNESDEPLAVTNYWFEYSTDSTFASVAGRDTTLTDTTKTVSGLVNNTKYYWRVKAKNQLGWNIFSQIWNFTTIVAIPAAPVLSAPANGATGISAAPIFDWNDVTGATAYRLLVASDSLFTNILINDSTLTSSQYQTPSGVLGYGMKYYWKVNARNISGSGSYSAVWNFTTITRPALSLKVFLEGFYDVTSGTQISDTVKVYLADSTQGYAFVDSARI